MFIAAIKCDFCQKAHEIPCRKAGDRPDVPDGWAVVTPQIRIKGTPNIPTEHKGKLWNPLTSKFDKEVTEEHKEKMELKKVYVKRRDELRKRFDKNHVCEDCIEEVLTGRVSTKLSFNGGNNSERM